ncbi:unnamed protein product, partial [Prunus brigantina]
MILTFETKFEEHIYKRVPVNLRITHFHKLIFQASLDYVRFLLKQGLPFRGHDESDTSNNMGNYLELLQFLVDHDEKVKAVVLENAPGNLMLIAPTIQKDLVNACAIETIKKIIKDMVGAFFSLLVDESRDVSIKEHMAVVFHYLDKSEDVIERTFNYVYLLLTLAITLLVATASVERAFSAMNIVKGPLRNRMG